MPQALKVGIFMTVCLGLLGFLILKIEDWNPFADPGRRIDAVFASVVGLDDKAAVRLAGVRVGRVDGIRLEGRRARVTLLLDQPVPLVEGSYAAIANQGLLGDKFVELVPGPEGAPELPADAVLEGRTPVSFDDAMAKISEIGSSIQSFFDSMEGEGGGGLGSLISALEGTAGEVRDLISQSKSGIAGTIDNFERFSATLAEKLPGISERVERLLAEVESVVAENRGDLKASLTNVKDLTERVRTSIDNLNTITDKIVRGEGTIGKLVSSDEAHDTLMSALGSVESGVSSLSDTLGRAAKVRLDLGLESAYLSGIDDGRAAFRLDLLPRGDESPRTYRAELVSDPRGRIFEKEETVTVTRPDGTIETTITDRMVRDRRRDRVSVLVGFPFATDRGKVWAGLIESTGGLGVDYSFFDKRLTLSLEAFDFGRELDLDPHLRFTTRWSFTKSLYLQAGYDDPLVEEFDSAFLGAGVRWTDDDLKYFLGSLPSF